MSIDEVVVNTFNSGHGAFPGIVSILDMNGQELYSAQAYGGMLADVANGIWTIAPEIIYPTGTYTIAMSNTDVLSYNEFGEPMFYVTVSKPVKLREDFTGTYHIDLDSYKTSSLMGPVDSQISSFSLRGFELTVLDHGDRIEFMGKYEGIPLSKSTTAIDLSEISKGADIEYSLDLLGLPARTRIGANLVVVLTSSDDGSPTISITGVSTYERAASSEKGADYNTYNIVSQGKMIVVQVALKGATS